MVKCTVRFILTFTISSVQVTRIKLLAITILCYPKENGNYGTCFTRYVFDSFYTECSTWSIGLYLHFSFPVRTDIILMQQPTHSLYFVFFFFFWKYTKSHFLSRKEIFRSKLATKSHMFQLLWILKETRAKDERRSLSFLPFFLLFFFSFWKIHANSRVVRQGGELSRGYRRSGRRRSQFMRTVMADYEPRYVFT